MKKELPKVIKETFLMDPTKGSAYFCAGLSKPGYKFHEMNRKGSKVVVTFVREDAK